MRPDEGTPARILRIDGTTARSSDELLDVLRVVWLTPAMDGLFTGPATERRRFLDRMVLTVDPEHGRRTLDYEKAMRGRNRLLTEDRLDDRWLAGIERQMAELGLAIALARADLVARLAGLLDAASASPFPVAELDLQSGYDDLPLEGAAVDLEDHVAERLARRRMVDRAAGRTLEAPIAATSPSPTAPRRCRPPCPRPASRRRS